MLGCVAEFTPTPMFETMSLFIAKDIFAKQSNEPHPIMNTNIGVGVNSH